MLFLNIACGYNPVLRLLCMQSASISEPRSPFLLFLFPSLIFECLQFLLTQFLPAPLRLQTLPVMAVCSSINIEKGIHLPATLVLVIELFRVQICGLPFAGEPVELSCRG